MMKAQFVVVALVMTTIFCIVGLRSARPHAPQPQTSRVAFDAVRVAIVHPAPGQSVPAQTPAKGSQCPLPIPNGQVLQQHWGVLRVERGNTLKIENHSAQNAIIKVKDPILGRTRLALFVAKGKEAKYDALPEGKYIIDYALGQDLDGTCTTFTHLSHAGQIGFFGFMSADNAGGSRFRAQNLTISAAPDLNAELNAIDADTFNFD